MRPLVAEALGTFWIVYAVTVALSAGVVTPGLGAGAVAGMAYLAAALSMGRISAGHFNPIYTLALRFSGGFGGSLTFTLLAQIAGATAAVLVAGDAALATIGTTGAPTAEAGAAAAAWEWQAPLRIAAMCLALGLVHLVAMRLGPHEGAYANTVMLVLAVALVPEGLAALNAAHATGLWLAGAETPDMLWRHWLAVIVAVAAIALLWSRVLRPEGHGDPGHAHPHG